MIERGLTVLPVAIRVTAILTEPRWREDRVLKVVVNELIFRVVGIPLLIALRFGERQPFPTLGFDVANDMTEMAFNLWSGG